MLFAHSTLCAWGFYALQASQYLFGKTPARDLSFKLLYIIILPIGALLKIEAVVALVDSAFFLMALPNVLILYLFAPEIKRDINSFMTRAKASENRGTGDHHA